MKIGCSSEAALLIQRGVTSTVTLATVWGNVTNNRLMRSLLSATSRVNRCSCCINNSAAPQMNSCASRGLAETLRLSTNNRLMRQVLPGRNVLPETSGDAHARIHHCRLKKFNPSSIARFLDPTIKLNLHNSSIGFNRCSPFNFVCIKFRIENCFVFDVTHLQEIWHRPIF